jgi:hypothetical protein
MPPTSSKSAARDLVRVKLLWSAALCIIKYKMADLLSKHKPGQELLCNLTHWLPGRRAPLCEVLNTALQ